MTSLEGACDSVGPEDVSAEVSALDCDSDGRSDDEEDDGEEDAVDEESGGITV